MVQEDSSVDTVDKSGMHRMVDGERACWIFTKSVTSWKDNYDREKYYDYGFEFNLIKSEFKSAERDSGFESFK